MMGSRDDQSPPVPEGILSAVAYAAREFLRAPDWVEAVPEVLRRLGEAAAASRAYVFENRTVDGVLTQTQLFEWVAPRVRPTIDDPGMFEAPYSSYEERWVQILSSGGIVAGPASDFSPDEREYVLQEEDILSTAFVPVFVGNEWWGYLGFDDCETERQWTPGEIDALRTAAEVVGAAIERRSLDRRLREADEKFRVLVENIPAIIYIDALEGASKTLYVSPQIERMLGYTPEEWTASPESWVQALHPDDRERALELSDQAERTGEGYETEYRMIARDGRTIWVHEAADLLRDERGDPVLWQGVLMDTTARKEAESRLREVEERYRDLVEQVPAILYTDRSQDDKTLYVSPQVEQILGVTAHDYMEDPDLWAKMIHPDDRDRVLALYEEFRQGRGGDLDDYRMVRPDGRVVWIRDRARTERDAEGRVQIEQGMLLDVTELKEAEALLREAEAKYRNLIEQLPAVVYTEGVDGGTTYIGPQVEELVGVSSAEWLSNPRTWAELLHPSDMERTLAAEQAANDSGKPFAADYRLIGRNGRTVWMTDVATLVRDESGEPLCWQGIMLDVTDRKAVEEQLLEAEERFRVLVESMSAVTYIDSAKEFWKSLYVSPQVEDMFGCTMEEWLQNAKLWLDMLHPDDRERIAALDERTDETGESFSAEFRIINARGETVWIHDESNLVRDFDGSPLYWLGVMIDITENKHAETLERDLALEQATSARLRELDQAKDALLTAVSHDFRAPLSNILGFAATLEESSQALSPERTKDFIHRIAANGWRLERLVADIMEVSRLREGPADIERMTTDLAGLVERVVDQSSLGEKYPLTVASEPIVISVDLPKVERLVQNLITNAVVHNPDGAAIRVRVGPVPGGAQIAVEDDGKGVPDDVIAGLFEEFTVDEDTRYRGAAPGLGLGLSIVKQFAELHGGRVWHEEVEGGGAAFRVFLPGETAGVDSVR